MSVYSCYMQPNANYAIVQLELVAEKLRVFVGYSKVSEVQGFS